MYPVACTFFSTIWIDVHAETLRSLRFGKSSSNSNLFSVLGVSDYSKCSLSFRNSAGFV
jgi:hypothetical protein